MKILIVGNGGREHALLWKLSRDEPAASFYATRPNPGMATRSEPVDLDPTDVDGLASWAQGNETTLTVVGPEVPLAAGIVDTFRSRGLAIFGPSAAGARIESSKAFAKEIMVQAGVPTAAHRTFTVQSEAEAYIREQAAPLVVKASGLAAGKGVIVCPTPEEALGAARGMLEAGAFGEAGQEIVIEEWLEGEELSVFAVTDGRRAVLLLPSQDHKRIGEGDTGPNTGGMGAYAPVPQLDASLEDELHDGVFLPVLDALERAGSPFRGLLYAGLMLTPNGPKVIEFNCRFGDPETQVVLPLMESSLLDLMIPIARGGTLDEVQCSWRPQAALNTVLAAGGYPGSYERDREVTIPDELSAREGLLLFHAGTREAGGRLLTAGGRVLSVVGVGSDLEEARKRSLAAADAITFEGKTLRRDIGWRALSSSGARED